MWNGTTDTSEVLTAMDDRLAAGTVACGAVASGRRIESESVGGIRGWSLTSVIANCITNEFSDGAIGTSDGGTKHGDGCQADD